MNDVEVCMCVECNSVECYYVEAFSEKGFFKMKEKRKLSSDCVCVPFFLLPHRQKKV